MPEEVFEELEIVPNKFRFGQDKHGPFLYLTTREGTTYEVRNSRVLWRIYRFNKRLAGFDKANLIANMDVKKRSELLTRLSKEHERTFRVLMDDEGKLVNIVSLKHKQVPYDTIWAAVESAVSEALDDPAPEHLELTPRVRSYPVPVEDSRYVTPYITIDAGANMALGRSAIYMYARIQITGALGLGQVPCLNWARFWADTTKFFNIEIKRINQLYRDEGTEKFEEVLSKLNARKIHTKGTMISKDDLLAPLAQIRDGLQGIDIVIDEAIQTPLTRPEMDVILHTYEDVVGLPKYVVDEVMKNVLQDTVWGFSNAVSWVRTHTELKTHKQKDPFTSRVAWKLESIAGEVLSLAPTIHALKATIGPITREMLIKPPKEFLARHLRQ